MKKLILLSLCALAVLFSCVNKDKSQEKFVIKRGVNLSHWLSQDFGWEPKYTYIKESDIRFIDSIGYDHVRIPIDEAEFWDEKGEPVQKAFEHLISCLDWCATYDLRAIVDLHIIRSHYFNATNEGGSNALWTDTAAQSHFVDLWLKLSSVLNKYPTNMVAYELLNEAVAPTDEDWNDLYTKAYDAVRKLEPERTIVIGANMWQIVTNVPKMRIPQRDKNLIISFHCYSPLVFTHYTAHWTQLKYFNGKVSYPGKIVSDEDLKNYLDTVKADVKGVLSEVAQPFTKETFKEMFKPAVEFAKKKGIQLYCGEFGCLPTVPRADRLAYYKDIVSVFEEEGIAWANWEYKGEFGIYTFDMEKKKSSEPDFEFIQVLLNSK
jgi:endoglucanase